MNRSKFIILDRPKIKQIVQNKFQKKKNLHQNEELTTSNLIKKLIPPQFTRLLVYRSVTFKQHRRQLLRGEFSTENKTSRGTKPLSMSQMLFCCTFLLGEKKSQTNTYENKYKNMATYIISSLNKLSPCEKNILCFKPKSTPQLKFVNCKLHS